MARSKYRACVRAAASILAVYLPVALPALALADDSQINIFNPETAPVIKVVVTAHRITITPQVGASQTTISAKTIENNPAATNLNSVIAQTVAGAAAAPNGDIHIRGSHGQYSYYLDGAPLPSNVTGSFEDLINPKDIETLNIYTGGFPAEYGGQLAAVFDVTAKAGTVGRPSGFIQQLVQQFSTYQTTGQVGGSEKDLSYFLSGIHHNTDVFLSPLTETVVHDGGTEDVGFGKFDYQSGANDRITLDTGIDKAQVQIPNIPDNQDENGEFANLIWRHSAGQNWLRTVFYSHDSKLNYMGSPLDLNGGIGSVETNMDQTANYLGLRSDYSIHADRDNRVQLGFDADQVTANENFVLDSIVAGNNNQPTETTISDIGVVTGGDRSIYAQDDWTTGRTHINYGARYDVHQADITTTQLSPRFNYYYNPDGHDTFHAFYDRLFQPASIEDVKKLVGNSAIGDNSVAVPFQPERDDFFETGWQHTRNGTTESLDGYYRAEKNTIDDQVLGNTQIDVPINFSKGYARGVEFAVDGPLSRNVNYYANYARSWAKEAGPITGGLFSANAAPAGYFYDDHDQTDTASFGLDYERKGTFVTLDGEYGSGFPYGQINGPNGTVLAANYIFVEPHVTFNFGAGVNLGKSTQIALIVDNLLNHPYLIKQASAFDDTQWAEGRSVGVKFTQNF